MIGTAILSLLLLGIGAQRQDLPLTPKRDAKYWEWTKWAWTVEDPKVTAVLKEVDSLARQGQDGVTGILRIAVESRKQYETASKPDARPLVVWAYAARAARLLDKTTVVKTGGNRASIELELVPPIASYAYARTRFLVLSDSPFGEKYIDVGYRLIKKNPKDYTVKYNLVYVIYTHKPNEAKILNAELLRDYPEKVILYAQRGDVFDVAYSHERKKADLLEAKRHYEIFLQKASGHPYAAMVRIRLKRVTKTLQGL